MFSNPRNVLKVIYVQKQSFNKHKNHLSPSIKIFEALNEAHSMLKILMPRPITYTKQYVS